MSFRAYFDIPVNTSIKNMRGSSPFLLEKLFEELDGASEIKLSFFLYNNPFLHDKLEQLSEKGCKVHIYTIPLNGYTDKLVKIHNPLKNSTFVSSKYIYAEKIYKRIEEQRFPNVHLRIFPHTYVWHKQLFSRGDEAYSLHNKSIYVVMENGSSKCITSSSNLAFADPPHSDNLLVVENEVGTEEMFKTYFSLLDRHSLSVAEYESFSKSHYDFEYLIEPTDINPSQYENCYYTAPFITYNGKGSNHFVQDKIISFMNTAKQRLYICSQHFMDVQPFDKAAKSIVNALGDLAKLNPALEIKILKQTRAGNQAQGKRTFLAEQFLKQIHNVEQRYLSPTIHDKFIIADNKILVMTANVTPTQYAWGFPHSMKYEVNGQVHSVRNCFSEINGFHFIDDSNLASSYNDHFQNLWKMSHLID